MPSSPSSTTFISFQLKEALLRYKSNGPEGKSGIKLVSIFPEVLTDANWVTVVPTYHCSKKQKYIYIGHFFMNNYMLLGNIVRDKFVNFVTIIWIETFLADFTNRAEMLY